MSIRVTIGDMPPLLRSMVVGMLDQDPELEIVTTETETAGASMGADVLLTSEEALSRVVPIPRSSSGQRLFGLVAIAADGRDVAVVHLSARRRSLDDERRHPLSRAIREAAGTGGAAKQ